MQNGVAHIVLVTVTAPAPIVVAAAPMPLIISMICKVCEILTKTFQSCKVDMKVNSQSLENTQVGYISQKYTFDKYTLEPTFKPSYTFLSI